MGRRFADAVGSSHELHFPLVLLEGGHLDVPHPTVAVQHIAAGPVCVHHLVIAASADQFFPHHVQEHSRTWLSLNLMGQ